MPGLAYPCGVTPGFDPTHVAAAGISSGHGFSGIALSGNIVNLLTGKAGTRNSTPTSNLTAIGPTTGFTSTQNTTFAGQSAINDQNLTVGAILTMDSLPSATSVIFSTGSVSAGFLLFVTSGNAFSFRPWANTVSEGTLNFAASTPYFVAASFNWGGAGSTCNTFYVVANLFTGQTRTQTISYVPNPTAPDGTYSIGNGATTRPMNGKLAAAMFSPRGMGQGALLQWAADPWSFWYPQQPEFLQ